VLFDRGRLAEEWGGGWGWKEEAGRLFIQSGEPVERVEAKWRPKSQYVGAAIIRLSKRVSGV